MPRVSVLMPAYNVDRYVAAALRSVFDQKYGDYEVIVINDGSTDTTREEIAPFMARIVYAEQPNRGLASARNAALALASGEFVALLDADDLWTPDRLERMVAYLDEHPAVALATSDSFLIEGDMMTERSVYSSLPRRWGFREDDQAYWITQYNFMQIHTVIRREKLEAHGGFDETLTACEDWDLWIRMLRGGETAGLVPRPLAYYRLRPGSLSIDRLALIPHELRVLRKTMTEIGPAPGLAGRIAFGEAKLLLSKGDPHGAREEFRKATKDRGLTTPLRVKALAGSVAPVQLWKMYRRRRGLGS